MLFSRGSFRGVFFQSGIIGFQVRNELFEGFDVLLFQSRVRRTHIGCAIKVITLCIMLVVFLDVYLVIFILEIVIVSRVAWLRGRGIVLEGCLYTLLSAALPLTHLDGSDTQQFLRDIGIGARLVTKVV
jgi:hypothetical protein